MRFLPLILTLPLAGCTTLVDDPGGYRAQRHKTIGVPGVLYTPSKNAGFGASLGGLQNNFPNESTITIDSGGSGQRADSLNPDSASNGSFRTVHQQSYQLDTYALRFPWDKSFVFYGLGVSGFYSRFAYDEHSQSFALNASAANVEWVDSSVSMSIPFGLCTNTKENWTTLAGFGPQIQVFNQRRFLSDGSAQDVDPTQRAATLAAFDQVRKRVTFQVIAMTGYSF